MSLNDLVQIGIDSESRTPSSIGFGEPLFAVYHTRYISNLVREYASLDAMVLDTFTVNDQAYKLAAAAFSQSPRPAAVKIGRRQTAFTQTIQLTPTVLTVGAVYTININAPGVAAQTVTYTVVTGTLAAICTGLAAAINALTGTPVAAVGSSGTWVVCTPTAGAGITCDYSGWSNNITFANTTADPGIQTDLVAIQNEDDNWYCLLQDSQGSLELQASALFVAASASPKLLVYNTSDGNCFDNTKTTDIMFVLKGLTYTRVAGLFTWKTLNSYAAAAWAGARLPTAPGSETWNNTTLIGVAADALPSGYVSNIRAKNGNVYTTVANVPITSFGIVATGTYIDTTRGLDWLKNAMQVNVFIQMLTGYKTPFTDIGAAQILSRMQATLGQAVSVGLLSSNPAPVAYVPLIASISSVNKASRTLAGCTFTGQLAGAIHVVGIQGSVLN